jgi:hypothetical protein
MLHFICKSDEVQGVIINLYQGVTLLVVKDNAAIYLSAFLTFIITHSLIMFFYFLRVFILYKNIYFQIFVCKFYL